MIIGIKLDLFQTFEEKLVKLYKYKIIGFNRLD